jgi:lipopolysaccharide export system protein LptA
MGVAHGENADKDKPMNIEADELVHDDLKQLTVFTGHVLVTKGTLVLKGDRIEVREDPQGFQYGVITPESGKRAFYRQKREGVNEFMEGEALRIEYDGRLDRVTLQDQAVLRRYRGTVINDEMSGHLITYDHLSETFRVDAKKVLANAPNAPSAPSAVSAVSAFTGNPKNNKPQEPNALGLLAPKSDSRVRAVLTPVPSSPAPASSPVSAPVLGSSTKAGANSTMGSTKP